MNNREWEVYALSDPHTQQVRYIGVTFRKKARLREHLSRAMTGGRTHRDCWIRSLIARGLRPAYAVIERGQGEGWQEAEQGWIAQYLLLADLVNLTDGGEGCPGYVPTPALRQKWAAMRAGVPYAPGRFSAMRGKRHTPEAIEKIRAASKGRKMPASMRRKLSALRKKNPPSNEQRARMQAASRTTRQTWEFRQKAITLHPGKQILCVETGLTFSSIRAAARALDVTRGAIQFALGRATPCKGYILQPL